jgi:hypothetical protein
LRGRGRVSVSRAFGFFQFIDESGGSKYVDNSGCVGDGGLQDRADGIILFAFDAEAAPRNVFGSDDLLTILGVTETNPDVKILAR